MIKMAFIKKKTAVFKLESTINITASLKVGQLKLHGL